MVVGNRRRARALVGSRLVLLTVGAVVMTAPLAYMIAISFQHNQFVLQLPPQFIPHHPTAGNYSDAWTSNRFGRYFFNSLLVACLTTVASLVLSSMMGYALARLRFPGRRLLFGVILVALMVPSMMLLIPQFLLAKKLLLLNSLWGLVFFYVGTGVAGSAFLLRSFFLDIPRELEEAMVVDGAGPWTRYRRLVLPMSRPALATVAIFTFVGAWEEFTWALTTINDPDKYTLPIAIELFQGQHATSWGLVFAASIIAILPVVLVFVAFQRQFIGNLGVGALKG
jgi:multiple sugar transport system permease protein